jgi:hypothetical protein
MDTPNASSQNAAPEKKKYSVISAITFFVALGLAIWTSFAEIWPTSMLIDIQAKIFDNSYYVKLTFLLTLLIFWLPMLGIEKLVLLMKKK